MTILFAGGEMGAFIPSDTTVVEEAGTSAFTRGSIRCMKTTAYAETFEFTETADCWINLDISLGSNGFETTANAIATFLDGSGTAFARLLSGGGGSATQSLQYWNGTAWTTAGGSITLDAGGQTLSVHIVANSASGSITLYVAGTERLTTGTIDLSAYGGVAKAQLSGRTASVSVTCLFSQVIIADEPTIGWRLTTVPATGAGATTDWTGGYTEIDEVVYSDADFINSATANQVELFSHSTTVPAGYTVRGVAVTARAKCGASGPQNIELALRSSGTTYFSASQALDFGYGAFVGIWETDPATSADFTASSIAALQFGVKSIT